jgi:hypothetical protein
MFYMLLVIEACMSNNRRSLEIHRKSNEYCCKVTHISHCWSLHEKVNRVISTISTDRSCYLDRSWLHSQTQRSDTIGSQRSFTSCAGSRDGRDRSWPSLRGTVGKVTVVVQVLGFCGHRTAWQGSGMGEGVGGVMYMYVLFQGVTISQSLRTP